MRLLTSFCFGGFAVLAIAAAEPLRWHPVSPNVLEAPALEGVGFGNGTFVASGPTGVLYSTNGGIGWTQARTENRELLRPNFTASVSPVIYADGKFLLLEDDGVLTSTNGAVWTRQSLGANLFFRAATYGNGLFAIGGNGVIATAPDARNWTLRTNVTERPIAMGAYGNGRFLLAEEQAAGADVLATALLTSTDGTNWTRFGPAFPAYPCPAPRCPYNQRLTSLIFGNGQFVAQIQAGGSIIMLGQKYFNYVVSPDGTNWTDLPGEVALGGFAYPVDRTFSFANGKYIDPINAVSSDDLVNWAAFSIPDNSGTILFGRGAAYGLGNYVLVGNFIAAGPEVTNLGRIDRPAQGTVPMSVAASENTIVYASANPVGGTTLLVSTNGGGDFKRVDLPAGSGEIRAVAFAQDKFVAVGTTGTILRSTNGVTWTKRLSNTASELRDIAFVNGQWVAVGSGGTIVSSADASLFSLRPVPTTIALNSVTGGAGTFVAVGESGAILTSTNAESWMIQGTEEAATLRSVAYGNGRFVAVGPPMQAYLSTNGLQWATMSAPELSALRNVAFAGGQFLATEENSATGWVSTDGKSWTKTSLPISAAAGLDSVGGDFWLGGGNAYLARSEALLSLRAELKAENRFTLTAAIPEPGSYTVLASTNLENWQVVLTTNVSSTLTYTESEATSPSRYFLVRKE